MFYVCYMRNETTVLDLVGDEVCGTNEENVVCTFYEPAILTV